MKYLKQLLIAISIILISISLSGCNSEDITHTVTFNSNGGSEVLDQVISHNSLVSYPNAPTRDDYSFLGWYLSLDSDEKWNFETDEVTEDITLYARWGGMDAISIIYATVNGNKLSIILENNSSTDALVDILKERDITYTATDYGNFEKYGNIGVSLPTNNAQITAIPGDVMLYQGNTICFYYGTNNWSFTRIGKIEGYSSAELKSLLGSGSVEVTLSLK